MLTLSQFAASIANVACVKLLSVTNHSGLLILKDSFRSTGHQVGEILNLGVDFHQIELKA